MFLQLTLLLCTVRCLLAQTAPDVRLPPKIIKGPDPLVYYKSEQAVSFSCAALGTPTPYYEVWKNGALINRPAADGTYVIPKAVLSDQGYYQCKAMNTFGSSISNVSFLQMAFNTRQLTGNTSNSFDSNARGQIICNVSASVPAPDYYWSFSDTDTKISEGKNIQIRENGDLLFGSITKAGFSGRVIRCNADNSLAGSNVYGSYATLLVTENFNPVPPSWYYGTPTAVVGLEGQSFRFRCFFSGFPEPTVTWKKNGFEVPVNRWQESSDTTQLTTKSVLAPEDEGSYFCQGRSSAGSADQTMQLTIEAAPTFRTSDDQPHSINVTEGDTVTIACNAYSKPTAAIKWYKNGVVLDPLAALPPKFALSGDLLNLTIKDVCKNCPDGSNDLMVIQCNVSNIHGYAFAEGYMNVLVATIISSPSDTKIWTPNQNVVFPCKATTDDSTPLSREWQFNDQPIKADGNIYVDLEGSLHIIMDNATDGGKSRCGIYKCVASNGVSRKEITLLLQDPTPGVQTASLWWISLIFIGLILLILLLLLLWCCLCRSSNEGDTYLVDEKERKNGNDPVKELKDSGFHDYQVQDPVGLQYSNVHTNQTYPLISGSTGNYTDDDVHPRPSTYLVTNGDNEGDSLARKDPNNLNNCPPFDYDPFTSGV